MTSIVAGRSDELRPNAEQPFIPGRFAGFGNVQGRDASTGAGEVVLHRARQRAVSVERIKLVLPVNTAMSFLQVELHDARHCRHRPFASLLPITCQR